MSKKKMFTGGVYLINPKGEILATSEKISVSVNKSDQIYFNKTMYEVKQIIHYPEDDSVVYVVEPYETAIMDNVVKF